ncbi:MAG: hypothetical protein DRI97_11145, partial [Bacteroidetes bacterium]
MAKNDHKIDEDYLGQIVNQELADAETWMDSDLASDQAKNLDYYYGEPFGNEEEGFSQIVTRDVLETVEGIMPDLMKIFTSGDQVVEFDPVSPADEISVEIQGRYINHLFMNRFGGYKLMYNWFKDSLLMRNGIIKVGWDDKEEIQFRTFGDLTKEEYEILKKGASEEEELQGVLYEIDSYSKDDDVYEVRLKLTKKRGRPDVCLIPSEEFRIKERSTSIADSPFVAHITEKTLGELLEMGYDEDDIEMSSNKQDEGGEVKTARFKTPREGSVDTEEISASKYERFVDVAEAYVRLYDPEDKKVKLYKVFQIGRKCMDFEEVDRCPMISLSPIMVPHKYSGLAVADLVRDIQEIRSNIMRQMLDNLALQNAGRYTAVEGQVNLQDLIDNKIGGVVRQKVPGAVTRLDTPDLSQFTMPVLENLDVQKENRTGVSRMTQGLDENSLNSHQTVGAVTTMMSAAQGKILLIARNFAETGVKDLFLELYNQIREFQTTPDILPVAGRFAVVNPPEWQDRYDVHVTVGIGNGNKDQQLMHLNNIGQMISGLQQTKYGYLITADNAFNLASEFIKNSGYINPTKFISNPATVEEPHPPPNPDLIRAQADAGSKQASAQNDQGKLQLE